jgi:YD repeat-containing protein
VFPGGNNLALVFQISSPSGAQSQWLATNQFHLVSGTAQNGAWAATFTIPQYSESGIWKVQSLILQDAANNSETLNAASIGALGFSPNLTVSDSSPDLSPPQLTGFSLAPQTLDTSIGTQIVTATLQTTDNLSGVSFSFATPNFTFAYGPITTNPTKTKQIITFTCHMTGGTPQNGTWQCPITFPAFSDAGAWQISQVTLKDADTNTVNYSTAQLQALGFPTVINVIPATMGGVFLGGGGTTTNPTVPVAEPVNSATGNYFSSHVDLAVRGRGLSFEFTRYYNSLDSYSGPMGTGWNHTYNVILNASPASGQVTIRQSDGSSILFTPTTAGQYTPATIGLFDSLVQNPDSTFTLTRKNQTKLIFSASGKLTKVTDRNRNSQLMAYDASGNLTSVTDTVGRVFAFTYDGSGHLVSITDPLSRTVRYSYDGSGNLVSFYDALGGTTQYTYEANSRLTSATDPRGVVYLQNTFDSQGRVSIQKNGKGFATTFAYNNPSVNTTSVTDPQGNVTRYIYDSSLRIVQITNALGGTTSYTYDSNNDKTAIKNANGKTTQFSYDANGNTTKITDPLGNVASFTFDPHNDILTATNPAGKTTSFTYDTNGNLLSIQDALGNQSSFASDGMGDLASRTDAIGNTTHSLMTRMEISRQLPMLSGTARRTPTMESAARFLCATPMAIRRRLRMTR